MIKYKNKKVESFIISEDPRMSDVSSVTCLSKIRKGKIIYYAIIKDIKDKSLTMVSTFDGGYVKTIRGGRCNLMLHQLCTLYNYKLNNKIAEGCSKKSIDPSIDIVGSSVFANMLICNPLCNEILSRFDCTEVVLEDEKINHIDVNERVSFVKIKDDGNLAKDE